VATTAAERGAEDSIIKALGCWKSNAFHAYIKMPKAKLASFSKLLSSAGYTLSSSLISNQHPALI